MKILRGLFDHMVLQRNKRGVSDASVDGACSTSGPVTATVKSRGKALKGFSAASIGSAKRGKFSAVLSGIPAGGPYDIELSVADKTVTVRDVLVGDVWLLGGQSNMQGCGLHSGAAKPNPLVRAFFMNDKWAVAFDPIHNMDSTVDEVHVRLMGGARPPKNKITGTGPGVAFGQEMMKITGVPQGVIACGHGGTSMTQWDPKLKNLGSDSLYGAMLRRFVKNGSSVSGLVWYQGESDANETAASLYTQRMKEFAASLRRDTRIKNLPIAIVQISRVLGWPKSGWTHWNSIQEQERLLPRIIRNLTTVPAIDLTLDDLIHVSGIDQQVLGKRLAQAMASMLYGRKTALPPIELKSVELGRSIRDTAVVVAEFDNVVGKLRAGGRPYGFELGTPTPGNFVYDVLLDGKRALIRTTQSHRDIGGKYLWYGAGADPFCNITDEAGRSLPVFGPVPLGKPQAVTPFIRTVRVSGFLPSAGKLQSLKFPKNLNNLGMKPRMFDNDFCDMHLEIGKRAPEDNVVFWAFKFACDEPMRLALLLGYDGPCKAWLDGKQVYLDPKGANPALPTDKGRAVFSASQGAHEIVVALGTNKAAAWGVYIRLERLGVSKKMLAKGSGAYAMPRIIG